MDWSHRVIRHLVQEKRRGSFWQRRGTLSVILLARLWKRAKEEERLHTGYTGFLGQYGAFQSLGLWMGVLGSFPLARGHTRYGEGPGLGNLKNDAGLLWSSDRSRYGS